MPQRLLKCNQVKHATSLCTSKIYRLMAAKEFPTPIRIGHRVAWCEDDVNCWIAEQLAANNHKPWSVKAGARV